MAGLSVALFPGRRAPMIFDQPPLERGARLESPSGGLTLVDAHVHLYGIFDLQIALDAAATNFRNEAGNRNGSSPFVGVLLLADPEGADRFSELKAAAVTGAGTGSGDAAGWQLHGTADDEALIARRKEDDTAIVVVAGRQIATSEGLEVLALATRRKFPARMAFFDTVEMVLDAGAMVVVPWGFGKWLGRRGRLVQQLVTRAGTRPIFLADSGVRPAFWPRSPLLRSAERLGVGVVAGSDPFPLAWDVDRIGSCGLSFPGMLSVAQPLAMLRSLFRDALGTSRQYGPLQSPYRFLRNQIGIRVQGA